MISMDTARFSRTVALVGTEDTLSDLVISQSRRGELNPKRISGSVPRPPSGFAGLTHLPRPAGENVLDETSITPRRPLPRMWGELACACGAGWRGSDYLSSRPPSTKNLWEALLGRSVT